MVNIYYMLKEPPECPTMYLGADIYKYHVNGDISGTECWAMSADSHVKKALEIVQDRLREDNVKFKGSNKTAKHPFPANRIGQNSTLPKSVTKSKCNFI